MVAGRTVYTCGAGCQDWREPWQGAPVSPCRVHGRALTNPRRPERWSLVWARFADHAAAHLSSLDPRTDRLPILRWWCRWREALRRAEAARRREAVD